MHFISPSSTLPLKVRRYWWLWRVDVCLRGQFLHHRFSPPGPPYHVDQHLQVHSHVSVMEKGGLFPLRYCIIHKLGNKWSRKSMGRSGRQRRHCSGLLKREPSSQFFQSIFVPALTYGHKLWVVTPRDPGYKRRNRVSTAGWPEAQTSGRGAEQCLLDASIWMFSEHD